MRPRTSLRQIGRWLARHGETIYGTRGGPFRPAPGAPRPDLAERHAADERAYVRNYARRVAEMGSCP